MLFLADYDYGLGNELVPLIKSEMKTTLMLIIMGIVSVWSISMTIRMLKDYRTRFWREFFTMLMICGLMYAFFSEALYSPLLGCVLIVVFTIIGVITTVIGEYMDDMIAEEQERKARFRRQREIMKYRQKRGI